VLLACVGTVQAQTDDSTPFYAGGSLGVSRVSNVYREPNATNDDTVTSAGLLAGLDKRLGRQHLKLDGSLQNNRYATNSDLNNRSYSLRGTLDWQTVGHLSGVLGASSNRSLADFNVIGVTPVRKKNIERSDEYRATARLGSVTRYTLEGGWTHRRRSFSAAEYDRFAYEQDTASLGVFATPGSALRLGLVGRRTDGRNPRYPVGFVVDPTSGVSILSARNDYERDDVDLTGRWSDGGSSTVDARISRSRTRNSLDQLRDFSGTTGSVSWNWRPTGKLQFNTQYTRDTGQESIVQAAEIDRIYTTWQLGASYALTAKLAVSANVNSKRGRRSSDPGVVVSDALDDSTLYNLGVRWNFYRGFSLSCQADRVRRDSSVPQYVYTASSYGCTGQALIY
jgi:hypothetical protein